MAENPSRFFYRNIRKKEKLTISRNWRLIRPQKKAFEKNSNGDISSQIEGLEINSSQKAVKK